MSRVKVDPWQRHFYIWFRIFVCFEFARHSSNVFFFKEFFLINLISSPLMKLGFTPRRVERGKVCILKGFSRPIVGFDACPTKIDFSLRCSPLKTIVSRKVTSLFHISAVDLIFGMGFVSFFNKKLGLFCYSPKERTRHQWNVSIGISMLDYVCFSVRLVDICKGHCCFYAQCNSMGLKIIVSIELK